jgi:hypothetical protein
MRLLGSALCLIVLAYTIHFFYLLLARPIDLDKFLGNNELHNRKKYGWFVGQYRRPSLKSGAYFLAVALGIGFCIYQGIHNLLGIVVPYNWLDAEQRDVLSGVTALYGSFAILIGAEKLVRRLAAHEEKNSN